MRIPLVLIHGWGVHSKIWQPVVPLLESDFDITLVDLPGYGSKTGAAGNQTLESNAKFVLAQAPPRAVWVGWSLGGTIALAAALQHPERFDKLQLVSTTPRFLSGEGWDHGVDPVPFKKLARQFEIDYAKGLKRFLLLQCGPGRTENRADVKSFVRKISDSLLTMPNPSGHTLREGLTILSETDLRSQLGELNVESQVIAGESDVIVPMTASRQLARMLPNARFHQLETGHLPFLEAPDEYVSHLRRFAGISTP